MDTTRHSTTYSARFPREVADLVAAFAEQAGMSKSQLIIAGTLREIERRTKTAPADTQSAGAVS